ncbi:unnamed protein product, partial [marine sediment metagenome]
MKIEPRSRDYYNCRSKQGVHHKNVYSEKQMKMINDLRDFLKDGYKRPVEICRHF